MPEPKSLVRESRMQGSVRGISSLQRSWLIPTRPSLLMSRRYDLPTPHMNDRCARGKIVFFLKFMNKQEA